MPASVQTDRISAPGDNSSKYSSQQDIQNKYYSFIFGQIGRRVGVSPKYYSFPPPVIFPLILHPQLSPPLVTELIIKWCLITMIFHFDLALG
jgi:hypothetical protein